MKYDAFKHIQDEEVRWLSGKASVLQAWHSQLIPGTLTKVERGDSEHGPLNTTYALCQMCIDIFAHHTLQ